MSGAGFHDMADHVAVDSGLRQLLHKAAALEADTAAWAARFERLFVSGTASFVSYPGTAFAVCENAEARQMPAGLRQALRCADSAHGLDIGVPVADMMPDAAGAQVRWLPCFDGAGFAMRAGLPGGPVACRYGLPGRRLDRSDWRALVAASHGNAGLIPVPAPGSRPLTALHAAEVGQVVLPGMLLDVRASTAWLCLELDARRLGAPPLLRRIVGDCLRLADNLIDAVRWPLPALRLDALLNRRVALSVSHVGERMVNSGLSPAASGTYRQLHRWLLFLRRCFVHESLQLASRRGPFPELCAAELMEALAPRYGLGNARRLLRNRLLRHRHLLALSPFSLMPPDGGTAWVNLVPAIACADSICMRGHQLRAELDLDSWQRLLQLTAAVAAGGVRSGAGKAPS